MGATNHCIVAQTTPNPCEAAPLAEWRRRFWTADLHLSLPNGSGQVPRKAVHFENASPIQIFTVTIFKY
jgi:hypothetical protein